MPDTTVTQHPTRKPLGRRPVRSPLEREAARMGSTTRQIFWGLAMGYHFSADDGQVIMDRILSKSRVLARHLRACGMKIVTLMGIVYIRNLDGTPHPYGTRVEQDRSLACTAGTVLGQRLGSGLEPGASIPLATAMRALGGVQLPQGMRTVDGSPLRLVNLLVTQGFLSREGDRLTLRKPWILFQGPEALHSGQKTGSDTPGAAEEGKR